jgi:nitrogen fixation/metabolism regulation signal transduction histidine kinase
LTVTPSAGVAPTQWLEALLDAVPGCVFLYDRGGRLIGTNRAAEPFRGTVNHHFPVEQALTGEVAEATLEVPAADGQVQVVEVRASPVRDERGAVGGVIVVWHDVTDVEAAATERARFEGALTTARGVAHELNNVLTALSLTTGVLASGLGPEEQAIADELARTAERAIGVAQRLEEIVRVEAPERPGG